MTIEIEIPGTPLTGNHQVGLAVMRMGGPANRSYRGRMYKTSRAASYQAMVYGLAYEVASAECWLMPYYAVVELVFWNMRGDVDGLPKLVLDGLQGVFYANDSRVKRLVSESWKDAGDPRTTVFCRPMTWPECQLRGLKVPVASRVLAD